MIVELQNCFLKIKFVGNEQEAQLHDWCHKKDDTKLEPLVQRGPRKCDSPKRDLLKGKVSTSIRWCKECQKQTLFTYRKGDKHSKCSECQNTRSSRGELNKRINKCLYPWRYEN